MEETKITAKTNYNQINYNKTLVRVKLNPPFEKRCLKNYSLICNYLFNKNFQIYSGTTRMLDALSQTLSAAICGSNVGALSRGWEEYQPMPICNGEVNHLSLRRPAAMMTHFIWICIPFHAVYRQGQRSPGRRVDSHGRGELQPCLRGESRR